MELILNDDLKILKKSNSNKFINKNRKQISTLISNIFHALSLENI
jgi:hypothetical protein